jgi:hypothetical protein
MHLDPDGRVLDERELVMSDRADPPLRETAVRGLEDCRLFEADGALFAMCTTTDRHPSGHVHQSVCRLDETGRVVAHRPLVGPFDQATQKNWLPFVGPDGQACALCRYDPLTVVRISLDTGQYTVDREVRHDWNAGRWRGSAGPMPWPDGRPDRQVVLVHEVVYRQGPDAVWERIYTHRFFEYDAASRITRLSRPFVFVHKGVEFACGLSASWDRQAVIVTFGVEDAAAYLCRMPLARLEALLDRL